MASEPAAWAALASPRIESTARKGLLTLVLLAVAHFFIDLYSIALGAFQPLLVEKLHLSLTQAGFLAGLLSFSSSLTQPLYGILSDRYHTRLFMVATPALSGVAISALGLAPSYGVLLALVFLGGVGIAAFHPQASANATAHIEQNRGRWMAAFISSGTLGLAMGPSFYSFLLRFGGLDGALWGMVPGLMMSAILWWLLPSPAQSRRGITLSMEPFRPVLRPLVVHYLLVVIRSVVQITFSQFLVLYMVRERGYSLQQATFALTLYLSCGALGGFLGGNMADRFGGRRVVMVSMISCVPFLVLFFATSGWLSLVGLALGGLTLLFTIPVNVLMAQQLVPTQAGTVSALMMGFAWGTAGMVFLPLTGRLATVYSLHTAMSALLIFPVIGFFLTWMLPKDRHA